MKPILLIAIVTALSICGDYLVKMASSQPSGLASYMFLAGAILYGLPAIGWFFLMKENSLAMIGVGYSGATIIILTAMGTLFFNEAFGIREAVGTALAILSVAVMSHQL